MTNALQHIVKTAFTPLFDRLMVHEGGYVNHPNDPGGETKWGVTKQVARKYGYYGSMRHLPKTTAHQIAERLYWDVIHGDDLDKSVAWQLMDAAYNHGNRNAIKMIQRAVSVADDGVIGSITLSAINSMDKNDVILRFNAERLEFYAQLRSFKTFGRGWVRRVAGNLRWAAKDN
ncbi:glycoside hydrolase family 108 protein [Psychrobacter sp. I-STPA10]|uniref:glycoside hydrolase family 108 protein n=1 Tax=Psychrobacter sp. I-STPA10 TaxID=2585769 RepID=UPI001E43D532|nr:glycosyl hydrolase 108 family protein [Psychrobacter sp. I-STPA10]